MMLGMGYLIILCIAVLVSLFPSLANSQTDGGRITKVYLSDGNSSSEGNVMVTTDTPFGEALPLCDDFFGMTEANTVCRELGFLRALRITRDHYFGVRPGRWTPDAWESMYILSCLEGHSLENCTLVFNRESACTSAEVAGVVCQTEAESLPCSPHHFVCDDESVETPLSCVLESSLCDGITNCADGSDEDRGVCGTGDVYRLESDVETPLPENSVGGTVYMKYNNTWKTICGIGFDHIKTQIICNNIGYRGGFQATLQNEYFAVGVGSIHHTFYDCTGHEKMLSQCPEFIWDDTFCSHSRDVGIFCQDGNLEVKLVGGQSQFSGRLQVTSSSLQYPASICNTGFDDLDAQVVCRSLGLESPEAKAHKFFPFEISSDPVWNIFLNCNGTENRIQDCGIRVTDFECTQRNTAAVTCVSGKPLEDQLRLILPADCGEAEDASDRFLSGIEKILGGRNHSRFDVPWLAAVRGRTLNNDYKHLCGASIISEYYLLTAAHCFLDFSKFDTIISVGNYNNNYNDPYQRDYSIEEIWIHEEFNGNSAEDNDIAVIKIKSPNGRGIKFGGRVKAVCLPKPAQSYEDLRQCRISGWGRTSFFTTSTTIPKSISTEVQPDHECEERYGSRDITSSTACFYRDRFNSPCAGDSGSPVTCQGMDGRHVLYGIHVSGARCRPPIIIPKNASRVTRYLRWILKTIARDVRLNSDNVLGFY